MRLRRIVCAAALLFTPLALTAQQNQQVQQPKAKSQKELDALKKVQADQQASDWDAEIRDINYVLENFADTEFKNQLLTMAMDAAQAKGDYGQTIAFGERAIQADPNNIQARVLMAEVIAQHTRENDLDKDQSIKKADDYANQALNMLNNPSTPPPAGVPPDRWAQAKKGLIAEAHDALGMADDVNKNYPDAINQYKTALNELPDPIIMTHLTKAYIDAKQYDDAIATADKVLAMPDASAQTKQFAQAQKNLATKLKGPATSAPK